MNLGKQNYWLLRPTKDIEVKEEREKTVRTFVKKNEYTYATQKEEFPKLIGYLNEMKLGDFAALRAENGAEILAVGIVTELHDSAKKTNWD